MDQVASLPLKFELRLRLFRLTRTTISKRRRAAAERMMSVMNQSDWYIDELSGLSAVDDKTIMRQRLNSRYSIIGIHSFIKVSKDEVFGETNYQKSVRRLWTRTLLILLSYSREFTSSHSSAWHRHALHCALLSLSRTRVTRAWHAFEMTHFSLNLRSFAREWLALYPPFNRARCVSYLSRERGFHFMENYATSSGRELRALIETVETMTDWKLCDISRQALFVAEEKIWATYRPQQHQWLLV